MARESSAVNLCVKYVLFFENFLIWLLGLACTALGAYILVLKDKVVKDPIDFFFDPSCLVTTAGAVTVFITFIGWMGALREYTSFLRAYNWILTLFLLGELVLIIFVFVFYFVPDAKQKLGLFPEKTFQDAIAKYGVVDDIDMKNLIDNLQEDLQCCGFSDDDNGYFDWNNNQYFNCTPPSPGMLASPESCSVPPSCCKLEPGELKNILCGRKVMKYSASGDLEESDNHRPIHKVGCLKAVGTFINDHAMVIGGALLGILIPQMFMMFLAKTLRNQILIQKSKWSKPLSRNPA